LDIHFTVGTAYERAAPLAEKNAAAGLSDFSVRGAARRHFSEKAAKVPKSYKVIDRQIR
jgi:hypothetical protein